MNQCLELKWYVCLCAGFVFFFSVQSRIKYICITGQKQKMSESVWSDDNGKRSECKRLFIYVNRLNRISGLDLYERNTKMYVLLNRFRCWFDIISFSLLTLFESFETQLQKSFLLHITSQLSNICSNIWNILLKNRTSRKQKFIHFDIDPTHFFDSFFFFLVCGFYL